jgi:hypothetical protein
MSKKAKLFVGISSRFGSLSEAVGVGGYTSYRISKAGMNMACVCMAHDPSMMGIGIKFLCLHPGWVQTEMVSSFTTSPFFFNLMCYQGSAGGRQCPLTVEESCDGMINVIQRAIDVQMYVMGSSVYEERTWNKKTQPVVDKASSTTEPSLVLKCPYSSTSTTSPVVAVTPPLPPPSSAPASSGSKCPYHGDSTPATASPPNTQPSSASPAKCPFSATLGLDSTDDDRLSFGSLDNEEGGSCPFGVIQAEVPAISEDKFHSIAERFQFLSSQANPQEIFENQFIRERCVFVGYDGALIRW